MHIVLEVVEGPHRGRSFAFDQHDNFIVGRARCAHFRLPKQDPYFSRVHFMVEVNPPRCRLVDLGSTNGTAVNGQRVEAWDLNDGDLIQGGDTVLKVSFVREPVARTPESSPTPPTAEVYAQPSEPSVETTETYHPGPPQAPDKAPEAVVRQRPVLAAIEGYRIDRELGRGGMGVVYLATRLRDGSHVAVKTIRPAVAASEHEVERFLREANILRQLRHPHVVAFHEMGRAGDSLFFAMDYVPGIDASRLLKRRGPLPIGRAVRLVCQVLEALQYAHGEGFVHRDIKPANLLISDAEGYELCKLADFGLARVYHASPLSGLTLMGDVGGTIPYMAPEQITRYRDASPAADQYSTAATLYRLLTGHYLFDFDRAPKEQQLGKILLDQPVPIRDRRPDLPQPLCDVIHQGLEKGPTARFPDAAAFRDALLRFVGLENA